MAKVDKSQLPDKRLIESFDLFTLALIDVDPLSLLPEVASLYGKEVAMSFIDIFGGSVIKVPSKTAVKDAVKRACIWRDFTNKVPIQEICDEYNLHHSAVYSIVDRYKKLQAAGKVKNVK